jgi:hypothetical protein
MLPVDVTFERNPFDREAFGSAVLERVTDNGPYILHVGINDPTGEIAASFDAALSRAISSGHQFKHLRCVRELKSVDLSQPRDYRKQNEEDRAFLRKVDAGEAELEPIVFDKVFFRDDLTTRAPNWSWSWHELELDHPDFQSARTAKWRREWLPHRAR